MYTLTPATEIHARIAKLQAGLRAARLDAAFLVQNADLFYFTGSIQQGILIVPAEGSRSTSSGGSSSGPSRNRPFPTCGESRARKR